MTKRNFPYKLQAKPAPPRALSKSMPGLSYTWENDPEHPDIAVAIILENAGEGSEMAAPLFRRAVALYFSDGKNAGGTMPWEESPYVPIVPKEE